MMRSRNETDTVSTLYGKFSYDEKDDLERDCKKDPPALFLRINYRLWDLATSLALTDAKEAKTWIKSTDNENLLWRYLPIHLACLCDVHPSPPPKLIGVLIQAYRKGLKCFDHEGNLPIHLACKNPTLNENEEILLILATSYPESLLELDHNNETPIDILESDLTYKKKLIIKELNKILKSSEKEARLAPEVNQFQSFEYLPQNGSKLSEFSEPTQKQLHQDNDTESKLAQAEDAINGLRSQLETLLTDVGDDDIDSSFEEPTLHNQHTSYHPSNDIITKTLSPRNDFIDFSSKINSNEGISQSKTMSSERTSNYNGKSTESGKQSISSSEKDNNFQIFNYQHNGIELDKKISDMRGKLDSLASMNKSYEEVVSTTGSQQQEMETPPVFTGLKATSNQEVKSSFSSERLSNHNPQFVTSLLGSENEAATILSLRKEISVYLKTINELNESLARNKRDSDAKIRHFEASAKLQEETNASLQKVNSVLRKENDAFKSQVDDMNIELESFCSIKNKSDKDAFETNEVLRKENASLMGVISNLRNELSSNHITISEYSNQQGILRKQNEKEKETAEDRILELTQVNERLQKKVNKLNIEVEEKTRKSQRVTASNDSLLMENVMLKKDLVILQEKLSSNSRSFELIASDLGLETYTSRIKNIPEDDLHLVPEFDNELPELIREKLGQFLKESYMRQLPNRRELALIDNGTNQELDNYCSKCEKLHSEINVLKSHLRSTKQELHSAKKNGKNMEGNVSNLQLALEEKLEAASKNEKKLSEEIEMLKDNVNSLRGSNNSMKTKYEEISWSYENLVDDNTALTQKFMTLEEELRSSKQKMSKEHSLAQEQYAIQKDRNEATIRKLQSEEKMLKEKVSTLEKALEKSYDSMQVEAKAAAKQISLVRKENSSLRDSINMLQVKYDKSDNLTKDLIRTQKDLKQENELLRKKSDDSKLQLVSEMNNYKKKIQSLTQYQDSLQTENIVMRNEITKLNSDNASLKIKQEELAAKEERIMFENTSIQNELADTKEALLTEIALMTDRVNDQEETISSLNERVQKLMEEKNNLQTRLDDLIIEIEVKNKAHSKETSASQSKMEENRNEIESLKQSNAHINQRNFELERNVEELRAEIENEKNQVQIVLSQVRQLTDANGSLEIEKNMLQEEIGNLAERREENIKEIIKDHKKEQEKTAELIKSSRSMEKEISKLKENNKKVTQNYESKVASLKENISVMEKENIYLKQKIKNSEANLSKMNSKNEESRVAYDELVAEFDQCKKIFESEKANLESQCDGVSSEVSELKKELEVLQDNCQRAHDERDLLERNNESEKEAITARNDSLLTTVDHLQKMISDKDLLLESQADSFHELEGECNNLREENANLQEDISSLKNDIQKLNFEVEQCVIKIDSSNEEYLKLEADNENLHEKTSYQEQTINRLQAEISEQVMKIDALKNEIEHHRQIQTENEKLKECINQYSTEVDTLSLKLRKSNESCDSLYDTKIKLESVNRDLVSELEKIRQINRNLSKEKNEIYTEMLNLKKKTALKPPTSEITEHKKDSDKDELVKSLQVQIEKLKEQNFIEHEENIRMKSDVVGNLQNKIESLTVQVGLRTEENLKLKAHIFNIFALTNIHDFEKMKENEAIESFHVELMSMQLTQFLLLETIKNEEDAAKDMVSKDVMEDQRTKLLHITQEKQNIEDMNYALQKQVAKLTSEMQPLYEKVRKVTRENLNSNESIIRLNSEIATLYQEMDNVSKDYFKSNEELVNLRVEMDNISKEYLKSSEELVNLKSEMESLREEKFNLAEETLVAKEFTSELASELKTMNEKALHILREDMPTDSYSNVHVRTVESIDIFYSGERKNIDSSQAISNAKSQMKELKQKMISISHFAEDNKIKIEKIKAENLYHVSETSSYCDELTNLREVIREHNKSLKILNDTASEHQAMIASFQASYLAEGGNITEDTERSRFQRKVNRLLNHLVSSVAQAKQLLPINLKRVNEKNHEDSIVLANSSVESVSDIKINMLQSEIDSLEERIVSLEDMNDELKKAAFDSDQKLSSYEKELNYLSESCKELTDINEKNFQLNTALNNKVLKLKTKLKDSNSELTKQIEFCNTEKAKRKLLLAEENEKVTTLISEIAIFEKSIRTLSESFNKLKISAESKQEENVALVSKNEELNRVRTNLESQISELNTSKNELAEVNTVLKNVVSGLKQKKDFLEDKLKGVMEKYKIFKSDISSLQTAVTDLSKLRDTLQFQNEDLTNQIEESETSNAELRASAEELMKKVDDIFAEKDQLEKDKQELVKSLEEQQLLASSQKAALLQMAEDHKLVINQSVQTINEMKVRHHDDQSEKGKTEIELEKQNTYIMNMKEEIESMKNNHELEKQRIKKLVYNVKKLLEEKNRFSSFLDSHLSQLFLEKKLLEQLTDDQFSHQREAAIAIDVLFAKNEKHEKDYIALRDSLETSNDDISNFLARMDSMNNTPVEELKSDVMKESEKDFSDTNLPNKEEYIEQNKILKKDNAMLMQWLKDYEVKVSTLKEKLNDVIVESQLNDNEDDFTELELKNNSLVEENKKLNESLNIQVAHTSILNTKINELVQEKNELQKKNERLENDLKLVPSNMNIITSNTLSATRDGHFHGGTKMATREKHEVESIASGSYDENNDLGEISQLIHNELHSYELSIRALDKVLKAKEKDLSENLLSRKVKILNSVKLYKDLKLREEESNATNSSEIIMLCKNPEIENFFKLSLANNILSLENIVLTEELSVAQNENEIKKALLTEQIIGKSKMEVDDLKEEMDRLNNDILTQLKSIENLRVKNEELTKENKSLKSNVISLQELVADYEAKIKSLSEKHSSLQSYNVCLKETVTKHKGIVARLKEISRREEELRSGKMVMKLKTNEMPSTENYPVESEIQMKMKTTEFREDDQQTYQSERHFIERDSE